MRPIEDYFKPYGNLGSLRGGTIRSFLMRVKAPFDLPNPERTQKALQPFIGKNGEYECAYCGKPATEWDHIEEASKGGPHQLGNLLPACKSCNSRKKPWLTQLNKVSSGNILESRRIRIEEYIKYLDNPGHTIFDKKSLAELKVAEEELFDAISKIDNIINKAIQDFEERET